MPSETSMSDGSVTVIDLVKGEVVGGIEALSEQGSELDRAVAAVEPSGRTLDARMHQGGAAIGPRLSFGQRHGRYAVLLCSTPRARKILVMASLIS